MIFLVVTVLDSALGQNHHGTDQRPEGQSPDLAAQSRDKLSHRAVIMSQIPTKHTQVEKTT